MSAQDFTAGTYPGITEVDYHSGAFGPAGSLSSTEAKLLLQAPILLRQARETAAEPKAVYDFGHVVHSLVLGVGLPVYVHDWPDLRTKAAKEDVAAARLAGKVPVKRADYDTMCECAEAVLGNPVARELLEHGAPEVSMYAVDEQTGVWMRGRVDWVTHGTPVIVDLKTTVSAQPGDWRRQAATLDYAVQREWYRQIWAALHGGEEPRFLHIIVEKKPPYLNAVVEMDFDFEEVGKMRARQALDLYARCTADDYWPGIPPIVHRVGPPLWYMDGLDDIEIEVA